jgi:hypothetical protein
MAQASKTCAGVSLTRLAIAVMSKRPRLPGARVTVSGPPPQVAAPDWPTLR